MTAVKRYLAHIKQAFPDLEIKQVSENNEGLVNDVVIVNGNRVFRFPKHDWAFGGKREH